MRRCKQCGSKIVRKRSDAKYCSYRCLRKANSIRTVARLRVKRGLVLTKNCTQCGIEFSLQRVRGTVKRKWCSGKCKLKSESRRKRRSVEIVNTCRACGLPVKTNSYLRQVYCNKECSKRYRRKCKVKIITCRVCKVPFTSSSKRRVYCSDKCSRRYYIVSPLTKECRVCKKIFEPTGILRSFCSKKCKGKFKYCTDKDWSKVLKKNCVQCFKPFIPWAKWHRLCSEECTAKFTARPRNATCVHCGCTFIAHGNGRTACRQCGINIRKETSRTLSIERHSRLEVKLNCKECGTSIRGILRTNSHLRNRPYCSRKCYHEAKRTGKIKFKMIIKQCIECGGKFKSSHSANLCSEECRSMRNLKITNLRRAGADRILLRTERKLKVLPCAACGSLVKTNGTKENVYCSGVCYRYNSIPHLKHRLAKQESFNGIHRSEIPDEMAKLYGTILKIKRKTLKEKHHALTATTELRRLTNKVNGERNGCSKINGTAKVTGRHSERYGRIVQLAEGWEHGSRASVGTRKHSGKVAEGRTA